MIVEKVYNNIQNPFLNSNVDHPEAALRFLFSYAQNLPDHLKMIRQSQPFWGVLFSNSFHAYTLLLKPLWDALESSSAEKIISRMKEEAKKFGNRRLNADEQKEIERALLSSLEEPLRGQLADFIKKHPLQNSTLRGYNLELLNIIMELQDSTADFKKMRNLIESVILKIDFLKSECPSHLACCDLNWHSENNRQLYGFAGCYLDGEIHQYVIKNGILRSLHFDSKITLGTPIPEPSWRPFTG
jgi:hypothetical protein